MMSHALESAGKTAGIYVPSWTIAPKDLFLKLRWPAPVKG